MRISDWSSDVCSSDLVIMGLSLVSYAVNLFIFSMGRITLGAPPVIKTDWLADPSEYADPLPQALVLTAIVIGFATTALFLVVLLASRGLSDTDHVDGQEARPRSEEHTSELQSLMRISYAVFCLKKKK